MCCSVSVIQTVFFCYNNNSRRYICSSTCDINLSHLIYCILSNKFMYILTYKHYNDLFRIDNCLTLSCCGFAIKSVTIQRYTSVVILLLRMSDYLITHWCVARHERVNIRVAERMVN